MTDFRTEKDSLGEFKVPSAAWYGSQTARAIENFPISGRGPDRDFVRAHVLIKQAAATANLKAGWLAPNKAEAIIAACQRILAGEFDEQFVVDRFQAGAGTSHNMNSNEVIANVASVALGGLRGDYRLVHPNDDVNMGQSTNDTIPTAIRLALLVKIPRLLETLEQMASRFAEIALAERATVKSARTHLQDAVPTTIGREFAAYGWALNRAATRLAATQERLVEVGLGGSAAGTALNTAPGYVEGVAAELARLTAKPIKTGDLVGQMQSMQDFADVSGALRTVALELTRIANDMRLLASGPRTGLGEITLPPVQPGSSIMPGKVNPVMFEMLNQVCYQVLGQDAAVAYMVQAGQLELNVMMPALGSALFDSCDWLTAAIRTTTEKNLQGLVVNRERCIEFIHDSVGLATLLNPHIGYAAAARLARESEVSGKPVRELVAAQGIMTAAEFDALVLRAATN